MQCLSSLPMQPLWYVVLLFNILVQYSISSSQYIAHVASCLLIFFSLYWLHTFGSRLGITMANPL